jgi:predicted Zn finger-like uncharacterized protein
MNVSCPQCETVYRVDPAKVPSGGVRARCATCAQVFRVQTAESPVSAPVAPAVPAAAPATPAVPEAPPAPATAAPAEDALPRFGASDPDARARRLARALVSDIVVYHSERRDRSLRSGTLRQEFREEIRKSWEEYASQVGDSFARETPHFRDALNEILASGARVF